MPYRKRWNRSVAAACALGIAGLLGGPGTPAASEGLEDTYIVVFDPAAQVGHQAASGLYSVEADFGSAGIMIVRSKSRPALASLPGVLGVARDQVLSLPQEPLVAYQSQPPPKTDGCASTEASCPLQWYDDRIRRPEAWKVTQGSPEIKVAILDTGITSRHQQVGVHYDLAGSRSFVQPVQSPCIEDQTMFASLEDFVGHGTAMASRIAGINGATMTGLAPETTFVNVRVGGACVFRMSWILEGMSYAKSVGARVVNMSLGAFICADGVVLGSTYCDTPEKVGDDPVIWQAFVQLVRDLEDNGSLVVASGQLQHVELDRHGRVVRDGALLVPAPDPRNDFKGTSLVPGGVPGVITTAAVNRVTGQAGSGETRFGQYGAGLRDQLSHYSNYGARIDIAAPAGGYSYNLPPFDCLSAECQRLGPSAPEAADNPGAYHAWGVKPGTRTPCTDCYVFNIGGTSTATATVSGVAALALAANPDLSPRQLRKLLRRSVSRFQDGNQTPAIASGPDSPWFNYDMDYAAGGIHKKLMGRGVVDAARAVAMAANWPQNSDEDEED